MIQPKFITPIYIIFDINDDNNKLIYVVACEDLSREDQELLEPYCDVHIVRCTGSIQSDYLCVVVVLVVWQVLLQVK